MKKDKITRYFDGLEDIAQHILRRIHREIGKKDIKVTGSQLVVMKKINERGQMTVSEVAEDLCVSLSAVTALVDRLCKAGHITRRRDERDRRVVWLELTPGGKDVLETCEAGRRRVLERFFSKLGDEDLSRLIEINDKLLAILKDEERGS